MSLRPVEPITLRGSLIRLEPLTLGHVPALAKVGLDPALWRWIPNPVTTPAEMQRYVEDALAQQARGAALPFAIVDAASGEPIGSTRYAAIEPAHRRLEIGWTWLAPSHQRSGANTEAKLLLLTHAFDTLGAYRVEIKTDALNEQSRRAIERLGAVQEGIFRRHVVTSSGRVRDTVYYSILDSEWPVVRDRLRAALQPRPGRSSGTPVVQTERLVLRRIVPDDAAFMLGLLNDPDWIRFIGDRGVRSVDAARDYLVEGPIAMYGREGFGLYRVEQKADGAPVGVCGLIKRPELADVDLGFAFMPAFRGLGYGVESAAAAVRYGLKVLGLRRIVAITSPDNDDSMRLLERIGMRFERRGVVFEGEDEVNLFGIDAAAPA